MDFFESWSSWWYPKTVYGSCSPASRVLRRDRAGVLVVLVVGVVHKSRHLVVIVVVLEGHVAVVVDRYLPLDDGEVFANASSAARRPSRISMA